MIYSVKVTTIAPDSRTLEGVLFVADISTNLVALNTRSPISTSTQLGDYHVLPSSAIQSFQIVSAAGEGADSLPVISPVDPKRFARREADRIQQLKEREQDIGKGVTAEGQAIFDALKRMYAILSAHASSGSLTNDNSNMPVRWHEDQIIAHNAVIIHPPYSPDDCKCPKDKQEALNRVRKALEGERRKIKEKEDRERKNAGPRKGG